MKEIVMSPAARLWILALLLPCACSKGAKTPTGPPAPTSGAVFIASHPLTAQLTLDGAPTGKLTPQFYSQLSLAAHTLKVRMVGYAESTLTFTPIAGATETVSVALRPLPGTPRSFATWKQLDRVSVSVAAGPGGNIYATTDGNFYVFSASAQTITQVTLPVLTQIGVGLAVDSQGNAFFGHARWLYAYSQAGSLLALLGEYGGPSNFNQSPVCAIGRADTVFVVDPSAGVGTQLQRYVNLAFESAVGIDSVLYDIAIDQVDGTVYAFGSDASVPYGPSRSVMKLSATGQRLAQWPTAVNSSITVAPDRSIFVAGLDPASLMPDGGGAGRIQHFSNTGTLLAEWGVENIIYRANIFSIEGIAVDASGRVYVTDFNGKRIIRFVP
jgi:outer membrane protein assembly factor BamB